MPRHLPARALAVACVAFACLGGTARASDESLAVLGIDALEVGDALGVQLTEALRKRAADTPGLRIVPGKDLVELKMVFACDGEAPACLAQAGRSLGADRLIYGSLKKADGGRNIAVSLKLLDVQNLAIVRQASETIAKRALVTAAIPALAARLYGQLIIPPTTGGLIVQSQPSDASVSIDGTQVGRTPYKTKDLRPRSYAVTVQADGYQPTTHTVEIRAGATESLSLKLEREQPRVEPTKPPTVGVVEPLAPLSEPPAKPRHPGRPAKYASIGLVAGAVVAGAVAIYTWRSYISLEDQASTQLRSLAPPAGTNDQRLFYGHPDCSTPPGQTDTAASRYVSNCQSGQRYAHATTGLWVTAGVLAAAGIVSFVVGDRLDAKAERERRAGQSIRQSLRLLPAVSTQGGGLSASFEF
jgi:hypothetical protein